MSVLSVYSGQITNCRWISYRGKLRIQQDSFLVKQPVDNLSVIAAVFDGHGDNGHHISRAVAASLNNLDLNVDVLSKTIPHILGELPEILEEQAQILLESNLKEAMWNNNPSVSTPKDYEFIESPIYKKDIFKKSGCTMTCLFLENTGEEKKFWIANLGDSRAACYTKDGFAVLALKKEGSKDSQICTTDHNLGNGSNLRSGQTKDWWDNEKASIEGMGGSVGLSGKIYRVEYELSLTRSLFDYHYRLIKAPDIYQLPYLRQGYIVLASDGVWDDLSVEDVGKIIANPTQFIHDHVGFGKDIKERLQSVADRNYSIGPEESIDLINVMLYLLERPGDMECIANFIVRMARIMGSHDDCTCVIVATE
jgi:serine/threonine protein phosphatase PrpC